MRGINVGGKNKISMAELKLLLEKQGFADIVNINGGGIDILSFPSSIVTCCALMRNSAADAIGFMADPRYEVYGSEDIDFSWELHKKGFTYGILKDVYVHHFRHRSLDDNKLDRETCLLVNNDKLFRKWSQEIYDLCNQYLKDGYTLGELFDSEDNVDFWFLRRINDTVHFYTDGVLDYSKFNMEKIS